MSDSANENAPKGDESFGARVQQSNGATKHDGRFGDHVAADSASRKPSLRPYLDAGLTLIPLHRWNAKDSRGRDRGKTPRDGAWTIKDYDGEAVAAAAFDDGTNVGVRLSASVVVLDVDPRNFADGDDSLLKLMIDTGLDLRGVPHTITGSGGDHYWFSKPVDVQLLDSLEAYPGVEFKSLGRQVVAAGSIHPNGKAYAWDGDVDLRDLPPMPYEVLRLARRPIVSHGETAGYGELGPEQLAETLEQLDACDFSDHNAWFLLMAACHHATAGEGRQEFIDWSTQDPRYSDHGWIIGRRWDSLHAEGTSQGGRPITVRYLHKVVQEHGGEVARVPPEQDFEEWVVDVPEGTGVDDALLRGGDLPKREGAEGTIDELNELHAVVMEGGKFRIFTEEVDPVLERPFFKRSTKEDFENLYCNKLVEHNDKLVPKSKLWLHSARRREYKGVIFDPKREHEGWLNLWRGWTVEPMPGDWGLLKELILTVLVDGNAAHFEWVMNWMAYMVQYPERVAEVALVFRGLKGTGKGTLGRALTTLAGRHGLHISSPEHLVGRFNSHLQNCICLFADEAFWAGDKAGEAVLKQLVTEPTLTYEGKGRDATTGKNLIHIVIASNNDWVVPATGGERRFAVFSVNTNRKGDKAFFDALNAQLDRGGLAAMLHELLTRDLGDWAPRDNVPQTEALAQQKIATMSPDEDWLHEFLEAGELPNGMVDDAGRVMQWDDEEVWINKDALFKAYQDDVLSRRKQVITKGQLGKTLLKAGIVSKQKRVGHKSPRFWVLPPLDQARAAWSASWGLE